MILSHGLSWYPSWDGFLNEVAWLCHWSWWKSFSFLIIPTFFNVCMSSMPYIMSISFACNSYLAGSVRWKLFLVIAKVTINYKEEINTNSEDAAEEVLGLTGFSKFKLRETSFNLIFLESGQWTKTLFSKSIWCVQEKLEKYDSSFIFIRRFLTKGAEQDWQIARLTQWL